MLGYVPRESHISIIISRLEGFINRLRPIECKLSNKTGKSCRSFRITSISLSFNFTLLHIHLIPFSLPFIVQYSFLFPFLILYFSLCLSLFFFYLCFFVFFHIFIHTLIIFFFSLIYLFFPPLFLFLFIVN